jgi:hypothetical protein
MKAEFPYIFVGEQQMPTIAAWEDYWKKSQPLFEQVLEKSVFWDGNLFKELGSCPVEESDACWQSLNESTLKAALVPWATDESTILTASEATIEPYRSFDLRFRIRHEITKQVGDILNSLRQFPEMIGRLTHLLELRRRGGISRRVFIEKHLMATPQFQALLEMAESEISSLRKLLVGLIKMATNWLWKRSQKLSRRLRNIPNFYCLVNHFESEKEKLWPLLMAFKNQ